MLKAVSMTTPNMPIGTISVPGNPQTPAATIDPAVAQIASYGGAIGALFLLLLIIRAATKFVREVKGND
jgi:hypothetical protein